MIQDIIENSLPDEVGGKIERYVDQGVRHKSGATPDDFLKAFLRTSRQLAYATQDDSWNEFEKEFTIIVSRMARAENWLRLNHPTFFED